MFSFEHAPLLSFTVKVKWLLHFIFSYSSYIQLVTHCYKQTNYEKRLCNQSGCYGETDNFHYNVGKPLHATMNQHLVLLVKRNGTQRKDKGKSMMHSTVVCQKALLGCLTMKISSP